MITAEGGSSNSDKEPDEVKSGYFSMTRNQRASGWLRIDDPEHPAPRDAGQVDLLCVHPLGHLARVTDCWWANGHWWKYAPLEVDDDCKEMVRNVVYWMLPPPMPEADDPVPPRERNAVELDTLAIIAEIEAELKRARAKFPGRWLMTVALAEEFGELAKAMLDESAERVRKEAIQVAVMAIRVAIDGDESMNGWREKKGLDFVGAQP